MNSAALDGALNLSSRRVARHRRPPTRSARRSRRARGSDVGARPGAPRLGRRGLLERHLVVDVLRGEVGPGGEEEDQQVAELDAQPRSTLFHRIGSRNRSRRTTSTGSADRDAACRPRPGRAARGGDQQADRAESGAQRGRGHGGEEQATGPRRAWRRPHTRWPGRYAISALGGETRPAETDRPGGGRVAEQQRPSA